MIDTQTKRPLKVSTDGTAGPYLMLPVAQLDQLRTLFDRDGIRYWVDSDAISLDGKPEVAVINFGRFGSAVLVQKLLDESA